MDLMEEARALQGMERGWRTVRWCSAALVFVHLYVYQPAPAVMAFWPPFTAPVLAGALVVANCIALAVQRWTAPKGRWARLAPLFVVDTAVALALVWLSAVDHRAPTWTIIFLPVIGAAMLGWLRRALGIWGLAALTYLGGELYAAAFANRAVVWTSITYRMGFLLIAAVFAGAVARTQRRLVDELAEARNELERRAQSDPLTCLANRDVLEQALSEALAGARSGGPPPAVFFVDLDGFKEVNDRYGHGVGDQVLIASAARLRSAVRPEDVVARVGGDEFCVLVLRAGDDEDVDMVAARIRERLVAPLEFEDHLVVVRASVGVAHGNATTTASRLIHEADLAMYEEKRRHRRGRLAPIA